MSAETNVKKKKKLSNKKKLRIIYLLLALAVVAAIVSATMLIIEMVTTQQAQDYYSSISDNVSRNPRPSVSYTPPESQPTSSPPDTPGTPGTPGGTVDESEWVPYVDFEELNAQFQGVTAAWLYLEGTVIDYPVMHYRNNDYFLRRLPDGTSHRNGSLYIDYRNNTDFTDRNTLIYGHNMRSGDMFGILKEYMKQEFYEQHPVLYIYTPTRDFALVLFAAYKLDSAVEVPPMQFRDDDDFLRHISNIKRRSYFRSDVEVTADDLIVSLCTCEASHVNSRLIVVGKLVDLGPFAPQESTPQGRPPATVD